MKMCINTLLFTTVILIIVKTSTSIDNDWIGLRHPSMMQPPPILWRSPQDIKYYFGQISEPANMPEVRFFESTMIKNDGTVFYRDQEHCINTSSGLRIGIAVIERRHLSDYNREGDDNPYVLESCKTSLQTDCNVSIVLYIACAQCKFISHVLNTSSIVDTRCHHALNPTKHDTNNPNMIDCFKHVVEPRIAIYEQILNGTHHCYMDSDINIIEWLMIGCIVFVILILIIVGTVYGFIHLKKQNVDDINDKQRNDDEELEEDMFIITSL